VRRAATLLVCSALLAGCGSTSETTAPTAGGSTVDASTASYGVDAVDWPNTMEGAREVFAALPETAAGEDKAASEGARRLDAAYGSAEHAMVSVRTVPQRVDPVLALAEDVTFQPCEKASREGTVPVPGLAPGAEDDDVWFSCHLTGYPDQRPGAMDAQTLGWVSGRVIWWVAAPDRETVAALVSPMAAAAEALPGDGPGLPSRRTQGRPPYGLQDAAWPETLAGVAGLAFPEVGGRSPEVGAPGHRMLYASYPGGAQVMVFEAGGRTGADAMLSAMFGLSYGCARGTFQGTAVGIGGAATRAADPATLPWFTCDVAGAEGDPHFRGHAAGWITGDLAWLVITPSRAETSLLVRGLVAATGS
jgi:uncharacterized protein YceK